MWLKSIDDEVVYVPREERVSFDLMVRYKHNGQRATVMLKDLTTRGAKIEGIAGLRYDEIITLMLPSLKAKDAFVVWVKGNTAGLEFERPLHPHVFDELVREHAIAQPKRPSWNTPNPTALAA